MSLMVAMDEGMERLRGMFRDRSEACRRTQEESDQARLELELLQKAAKEEAARRDQTVQARGRVVHC
jgi:Sec-independent protein translocase protein TatA